MNGLLFSLPGTPVLYYGDEIGMGDNVYLGDRNGVRTPMQWSADRNAGFSRANPQRLILPVIIDPEYHYEAINVEAQQDNPNSLLWWTKRLIALRKRFRAFGRGTIEFLTPTTRACWRSSASTRTRPILVVANLSRFVQYVELDLSQMEGHAPRRAVRRHTPFPPIGDLPYLLTLGGHAFYWFSIEPPPEAHGRDQACPKLCLPVLSVRSAESFVVGEEQGALEELLPTFVASRRWFRLARVPYLGARIVEAVALDHNLFIVIARLEYADHEPEIYVLPLAVIPDGRALASHAVLASLRARAPRRRRHAGGGDGRGRIGAHVARSAPRRGRSAGSEGDVVANPLVYIEVPEVEPINVGRLARGAWSVRRSYLLKVFRRLEEGQSPELELGQLCNERPPV